MDWNPGRLASEYPGIAGFFAVIGTALGYLLGGWDLMLKALVAFVVLDWPRSQQRSSQVSLALEG